MSYSEWQAGQAAKGAAARAAQQEAERASWLASPMGRATTAKDEGHPFFEIDLELSASRRSVTFFGSEVDDGSTRTDSALLLGAIESLGWRLEHAGYYFRPTGEMSRERVIGSSQKAAVSGETRGVYLFRNTD